MPCVNIPGAVCVSPWFSPAAASGGWRCVCSMSMARAAESTSAATSGGALNGLAAVVTEDAEADLYLAINRAADRIGRNVMRRLARHNARPDEEPIDYATLAAR